MLRPSIPQHLPLRSSIQTRIDQNRPATLFPPMLLFQDRPQVGIFSSGHQPKILDLPGLPVGGQMVPLSGPPIWTVDQPILLLQTSTTLHPSSPSTRSSDLRLRGRHPLHFSLLETSEDGHGLPSLFSNQSWLGHQYGEELLHSISTDRFPGVQSQLNQPNHLHPLYQEDGDHSRVPSYNVRSTRQPLPRRFLARITGLAAFTQNVEPLSLALSRPITNLIKATKSPNWNSPIFLNDDARAHLTILADILSQAPPRAWSPPAWTHVLATDALFTGYGLHLLLPEIIHGGTWDETHLLPTSPSINLLEISAAEIALKYCNLPPHSVIRLRMDNLVSVAYLSKGTGRIPHLAQVAERILLWARSLNIVIHPEYIQGSENVIVDQQSRLTTDWSLHPQSFTRICNSLSMTPVIDRFATANNTLLPRFNTRFFSPKAEATDAMSQDWSREINYWAPPLAILDKVISKIQRENAIGIILTPPWERAWLPTLMSLSSAACRISQHEISSIGLPFESSSSGLLAWRISGTPSFPTSHLTFANWWYHLTN